MQYDSLLVPKHMHVCICKYVSVHVYKHALSYVSFMQSHTSRTNTSQCYSTYKCQEL